MEKIIKQTIKKLPFVRRILGYRAEIRKIRKFLNNASSKFLFFAPPGHFYSPLPDINYLKQNKTKLFNIDCEIIPGIKINHQLQVELIEHFKEYYADMPFQEEQTDRYRYFFNNSWFRYADAIILYCMFRHFLPANVIEVGSGYSSAVMLDTSEHFLLPPPHITFIEPFPERLYTLLRTEDKKTCHIISSQVQQIEVDFFTRLQANDILFIDSSHISKIGSDVNYLLFDVMPRLRKGVLIHFHDIFWPFEYPETWLLGGRAWNETYLLRAFLQYNSDFKILFFNSYMGYKEKDLLQKNLPLFMKDAGQSLWLKKVN